MVELGYEKTENLEDTINQYRGQWVKIDSDKSPYFGVLRSFENWTATLKPCLVYEPILQDGNKPNIDMYRLETDRPIIAQCTGMVPLTKSSIEILLNVNRNKVEAEKPHQNPNQLELF